MGRARAAAGVALVIALLGGCDLLPGGDGSAPTAAPTVSEQPATMPTEIPSYLIECPEPDGKDPTGLAGTGTPVPSLAAWSVQTPTGFREVSGYSQFAPIEGAFSARYFEADDGGFPDALGAAYYGQLDQGSVTDECGRLDLEAATERIELQLAEADEQVIEDRSR